MAGSKVFNIGVKVNMRDNFSKTTEKMTRKVEKFAETTGAAAKAADKLDREVNGAARAAQKLHTNADKAAKSTDKLNNKMKHAGHGVQSFASGIADTAKGMLQGGIVMAGVAAAAVPAMVAFHGLKKAMDFESQMKSIAALGGMTKTEYEQMTQLALEQGAKTKYSALQAAQGLEELVKAGLTPAAIKAGGLENTLNLATAGGLELADAANLMGNSLNTFSFQGITAAQVANVLAGTANKSTAGVMDLKEALAQVGPVARLVKLPFEQLNAALGVFSNNGFKGSDAGTSLKTMLGNLIPETKTQYMAAKKLGLITKKNTSAFYDEAGNLKSLTEIAGLLHEKTKKLTTAQKQLYLGQLFGTDAIRAAAILSDVGAKGMQNFLDEMGRVTALSVAEKKMDSAAGAMEQLSGAIETLEIAAFSPAMPLIKKTVKEISKWIEENTPAIQAAMEKMIGKLRSYLNTKFFDNPEFRELSIEAKVGFIIGELETALLDHVTANAPKIAAVGLLIGKEMAKGMVQGLLDGLADATTNNPTLDSILSSGALGLGGQQANMAAKIYAQYRNAKKVIATNQAQAKASKNSSMGAFRQIEGSHANGLDRVPHDGYVAELHKDERVLTRAEADRYTNVPNVSRGSSAGGTKRLSIANLVGKIEINGVNKNAETMADEILDILYKKLNQANGMLGADMGVLL